MSTFRLALLVLGPTAAVLVAAACTPKERPDLVGSGGGGAGGASSGAETTGALMTTGTDATTTTSGIPTTSSGPCSDTVTDPANCGACGHDCTAQPNAGTASCANGICAFTCSGGFLDCTVGADDGCETDPTTDPKNCSVCGVPCGPGQDCKSSACADHFTSCAELGTCPDPSCEEPGRFSVDSEVAVDVENGRTLWQRSSKGPFDHAAALDFCGTALFDGIGGWRVPTTLELQAIVHGAGGFDGCGAPNCNPAVDQSVFADTMADDYWTSDSGGAGQYTCVNFCDGYSSGHQALETEARLVRCIHDPL